MNSSTAGSLYYTKLQALQSLVEIDGWGYVWRYNMLMY